ncbi:MAG: hypothetical protein Q9225_007830 [Loekoesia sp. 1 TL-2023]
MVGAMLEAKWFSTILDCQDYLIGVIKSPPLSPELSLKVLKKTLRACLNASLHVISDARCTSNGSTTTAANTKDADSPNHTGLQIFKYLNRSIFSSDISSRDYSEANNTQMALRLLMDSTARDETTDNGEFEFFMSPFLPTASSQYRHSNQATPPEDLTDEASLLAPLTNIDMDISPTLGSPPEPTREAQGLIIQLPFSRMSNYIRQEAELDNSLEEEAWRFDFA